MSSIITKGLLESSIREHEDFIGMVCKNKYNHKDIANVIDGVINYCNITNKNQKKLLRSGKFIPAGSILSACNNDTKGSFSNCYYVPIRHDSIEGIFDAHKEIARTFSYRGGVGTDITVLRPKEEKVDNTAKTSSGSVSFMPSLSELTKTICQNGRRGALLISIDIRHPDILDFIWSKAMPEKVFEKDIFTKNLPDISNANITIKLTDEFMRAVEEDKEWTFIFPNIENNKDLYNNYWNGDYDDWVVIGGKLRKYKTLKAKEILNQISEASWICGDPGISFIDTVQKHTFGTYIHKDLKPVGYNACSEQPMANDNNCLLGAFVLPKYIIDKKFDFESFEKDVEVATRIMNLISDLNEDKHPLQQQKIADSFGKRIGIEFTGFGDICAALGFKYGDIDSIFLAETLTDSLLQVQLRTSCDIAIEGVCCLAMRSEESRKGFIENSIIELGEDLTNDIFDYGLANTSFNTIGPCGSISIISGNCTSGIEPLFKFSYRRKNRIDNKEYEFIHLPACEYMLKNFDKFKGLTLNQAKEELCYLEADEIPWKNRIKIQSALQKNIDASISSTINLPGNVNQNIIQEIYKYAWGKNLKGVTVFRDGCKEGILSDATKVKKIINVFPEIFEKELLDVEDAIRHRVVWKKSKLYVNVSVDEDNKPIEIFAKLPKEAGVNDDGVFNPSLWQEKTSHWDSICRLVSMLLRYSIPVKNIIEQLDRSTYSMVDAAGVLKRVLSKYNVIEKIMESGNGLTCKECGNSSYFYEGGCGICKDCGYSECG